MPPPKKPREDRIFEILLAIGVVVTLALFIFSMVDAWVVQGLGEPFANPT